jgi:hypothetical protein
MYLYGWFVGTYVFVGVVFLCGYPKICDMKGGMYKFVIL